MPKKYQDISDEIINCDVRQDDVWMISYPRTGRVFNRFCHIDPYTYKFVQCVHVVFFFKARAHSTHLCYLRKRAANGEYEIYFFL